MNSTPECVTKTPEIEAREKLAAIFSDAEQRGDNSKVNPELGKTAIDIENTSKMDSADNGAVDFCNQALGENEKPTDPVESVKEIGNMLADLRKTKANEVQ